MATKPRKAKRKPEVSGEQETGKQETASTQQAEGKSERKTSLVEEITGMSDAKFDEISSQITEGLREEGTPESQSAPQEESKQGEISEEKEQGKMETESEEQAEGKRPRERRIPGRREREAAEKRRASEEKEHRKVEAKSEEQEESKSGFTDDEIAVLKQIIQERLIPTDDKFKIELPQDPPDIKGSTLGVNLKVRQELLVRATSRALELWPHRELENAQLLNVILWAFAGKDLAIEKLKEVEIVEPKPKKDTAK